MQQTPQGRLQATNDGVNQLIQLGIRAGKGLRPDFQAGRGHEPRYWVHVCNFPYRAPFLAPRVTFRLGRGGV